MIYLFTVSNQLNLEQVSPPQTLMALAECSKPLFTPWSFP